jgi:hypothetical protein
VTTGKSEKATKARCAGLRHISFAVSGDRDEGEAHGDTLTTISQIEVHNQVLDGKGCKDQPGDKR